MEMTDNDMQWLHENIGDIKTSITDIYDKLDNFLIEKYPDDQQELSTRVTVIETWGKVSAAVFSTILIIMGLIIAVIAIGG